MSWRRVLQRIWTVASNPYVYSTAFLTASCFAGDASRQLLQRRYASHSELLDDDAGRSFGPMSSIRFALVGGTFAPAFVWWYSHLDRWFPATQGRMLVKKLIVDQAVAGLTSEVIFFFVIKTAEQLQDSRQRASTQPWWQHPLEETYDKVPKAFLIGCLFWPAAQWLNFARVAPRFRTVFVGTAEFIWANILSFINVLRPGKTGQHRPNDLSP